jgi:hypothetical protein
VKRLTALALVALAACRPPASDGYVQRIELGADTDRPHVEAASRDVEGAIWASSGGPERIVFGKPGKPPYLALACTGSGAERAVEVTRFAETDPKAKGMMALVGNGHVERLKIDAKYNGRGWLWQGRYRPSDTRLDALTGVRKLELTIPGAGTLKLEGSNAPGQLIELCRRLSAPEVSAQPSAKLVPG